MAQTETDSCVFIADEVADEIEDGETTKDAKEMQKDAKSEVKEQKKSDDSASSEEGETTTEEDPGEKDKGDEKTKGKEEESEETSIGVDEVHDDVMLSGYWINLCYELNSAWTSCELDSDINKKLVQYSDNSKILEAVKVDECEKEHDEEDCAKWCRNVMMEYYGWFHHSTIIFEALQEKEDFRDDLYEQC